MREVRKSAIYSNFKPAEATEFPYLNHKYNVAAVPKVVINETIDFGGALPESDYLKHVMMVER
jgi:hypothetical protein